MADLFDMSWDRLLQGFEDFEKHVKGGSWKQKRARTFVGRRARVTTTSVEPDAASPSRSFDWSLWLPLDAPGDLWSGILRLTKGSPEPRSA
jgi:hypothetical protein